MLLNNGVTVLNLTPHVINVAGLAILPEPVAARLAQKTEVIGMLGEIPITQEVFGMPENLPNPEDDVFYIVSALMAGQLPLRNDLLVPGKALRDETGRIIGSESLAFMSDVMPELDALIV